MLKKDFAKNALWLALSEIVSRGTRFIVIFFLARHYGPVLYGQWGLAFSLVLLLSVIPGFGLEMLIIREIAREKNRTGEYISNVLFLKAVLGLVSFVLLLVFVHFFFSLSQFRILLFSLWIYMMLSSVISLFTAVFQAYEKMYYDTFLQVFQSMFLLFFCLYLIKQGGQIYSIGYAYVLTAVLGLFAVVGLFTAFFQKISFTFSLETAKIIFVKAWPFGMSIIAVMVYYRIDAVMLGIFKTSAEVGYYTASYNVILLFIAGINLLQRSMFPRISRYYNTSPVEFCSVINGFSKAVVLIAFPLTVLVFFCSNNIVNIVYGHDFVSVSGPILKILVLSVLVLYMYAVFVIGLSASNNMNEYVKAVISGAFLNIALNGFCIPLFSYYGAAASTVLTELFLCIYITRVFLRKNALRIKKSIIIKISAIIFCAGSVFFFCFLQEKNCFIIGVLCMVFYSIAAGKILFKEELIYRR